jgi:hypothetical protein
LPKIELLPLFATFLPRFVTFDTLDTFHGWKGVCAF